MSERTVSAAEAGTYLQNSAELSWMSPGRRFNRSERPTNKSGQFLDLADQTRVTFGDGDEVDIPFLLQVGAIEPVPAPPAAPADSARNTEANDGDDPNAEAGAADEEQAHG